ncbi:conserved hypothetical protein [Microsporum canis CBS 113480]|uniref:Uncharacterized protein n=1 Tax=Arthroderma otae (strain ATCC MYA-4605 / CBS 113480) TaxID=554155 RepID=C5FSM1_ARTOC|nr:conserved hypothetical protein [Microsporum canis CBS 113480]EEQ32874.1 conserved hypothetical protein [Microsporum canis CBS 113480]
MPSPTPSSYVEIASVPEYTNPELVKTPCGNLTITSGELNDSMKPIYPQGNGRSFVIKGSVYYIFETTVRKDAKGEIVGEATNSVALVSDPDVNPIANIAVPINRSMHPFLPLSKNEEELEKDGAIKVILGMPGGLCKPQLDAIGGYIWFEKYIQTCSPQGDLRNTFQGVGLAIAVRNVNTNEVRGERIKHDELLFKASEPAFGAFCSVLVNNFFYVWGKLGEDIYLARVERYEPDNRSAYEYWDGYKFMHDITAAVPVFSGYTSGTVMRSKMFGHMYNWVFIGGTKINRPVVAIGMAREIQGPYIMYDLINSEEIHPMLREVHSVYAHQWAFDEKKGQLLVSWNECDTRNVVAVKLQLAISHQGAFWKDISFVYMPCEIEHDRDGKTIIKILAKEKATVDAVASSICNLTSSWCDELLRARMEARGLLLRRVLKWFF